MGCFNLICGYSGLEIHSDDDVQLHFLVNNQFGDGFLGHLCYPHDTFSLLAPPIKASYNEYGWYEFDETNVLTQMVQERITKLIDLTNVPSRSHKGSKEYFEANQNREIADRALIPWEVVGELIHDGCLFIKNRYGKPIQVYISKFAVHDKLYQDIAAGEVTSGYGRNKKSIRDDIVLQIESANNTDVIRALRAKPDDELTDEEFRTLMRYDDALFLSDDRMEYMSTDFNVARLCRYVTPDGKSLTAEEVLDIVYGVRAFHEAMDSARKMYLPQGGGHQCYNFEDEIKYLESILAYVKERKAEWDDEYED